ncbi:hypothetical protein Rleg9DRAFT_7338 [Rhizobium leguminosarum bv. trifolii WSM597]|uniref:Uncharacterized protein n=1 Tax=Rhizobium leguminosarum bv. trifolii WSM597 TaxID=754764 RepID=J0HCX8_RHILT|nr:hypothetical protein Rleg9DRAFT_1098 [Rhizobium leguminosarum bv. trifolii WSM597]EJB08293.1 hypothetical protein Rleg9DRAFT_7338 [Rhizobium leguminosarum bv. trifolii WSM597]
MPVFELQTPDYLNNCGDPGFLHDLPQRVDDSSGRQWQGFCI